MKRWQRVTLGLLGVAGVVYGMIYADVVLRAREAFLEGEQYMFWADHPEKYHESIDHTFAARKSLLEERHAKGALADDDFARETELLEFEHQAALKESTLKYAYVWYQTAVDLFSPPNSRWVRRARTKMPIAKERWKAELRQQKVPFEDYMID